MADFNSMSDIQAYQYCGADASRWAEFFCHIAASHGYIMDKGWMTTWFANAMMAMHDHMRPDLAPVVLPDGSAFCPA